MFKIGINETSERIRHWMDDNPLYKSHLTFRIHLKVSIYHFQPNRHPNFGQVTKREKFQSNEFIIFSNKEIVKIADLGTRSLYVASCNE